MTHTYNSTTTLKILLMSITFLLLNVPSQAQWVQTNGPFGGDAKCFVFKETTMFVGTSKGLYRSTDNGDSWELTRLTREVNALFLNGENLIASSYYDVYRSKDNGDHWESSETFIPLISKISVTGAQVYATTSFSTSVYRSFDEGLTWKEIKTGLPIQNISSIFAIDSTILIGTNEGVYRSADQGRTWTAANDGFTTKPSINTYMAHGTDIFVGTFQDGAFRSSDNGKSWVPINNGLSSKNVTSFAHSGSILYVGTYQNGILI